MRRSRLVLAAFALTSAAAAAPADEILLVNGRKLEGKAQRVGDEVIVRLPAGEIRLEAKEVKSIVVAATKEDHYRERLAKLDAKDPVQQLALADWCKSEGFPAQEKKHLEAVIAIDPDHEAARARLGFIRSDDKWLTTDEYYASRGFVKLGKDWVSREEIARRDAEKRAKAAMDTHVRTIRDSIVQMQSPLRKPRAEGKRRLQEYAEKIGDPSLAEFASKVAHFYNEAWREVKAEWEGGTATVTVRATKSELKRPIPTLETSLGAFSTPVRIQLPELSIVSVKTTVRVPITIELDDE